MPVLAANADGESFLPANASADELAQALRAGEETRRRRFGSPLHRAADAYVVQGQSGKTIVAGYPWFTDWGRDTFIALGGLCIATGRLEDARDILLAWARVVSEGMLPNRFPDHGGIPEFNSVDASLWYVVAVHALVEAAKANGLTLPAAELAMLHGAMDAILTGYSRGTRYGIRLDDDGLLRAGQPGVQLTWMDADLSCSVSGTRAVSIRAWRRSERSAAAPHFAPTQAGSCGIGRNRSAQARIASITLPCTSVRRRRMPLW